MYHVRIKRSSDKRYLASLVNNLFQFRHIEAIVDVMYFRFVDDGIDSNQTVCSMMKSSKFSLLVAHQVQQKFDTLPF